MMTLYDILLLVLVCHDDELVFAYVSAGLVGPTLRAEEGETIVVTFRNMGTQPHSIHPHGVAYGKQSEGGCLLGQLQLNLTAAANKRPPDALY